MCVYIRREKTNPHHIYIHHTEYVIDDFIIVPIVSVLLGENCVTPRRERERESRDFQIKFPRYTY